MGDVESGERDGSRDGDTTMTTPASTPPKTVSTSQDLDSAHLTVQNASSSLSGLPPAGHQVVTEFPALGSDSSPPSARTRRTAQLNSDARASTPYQRNKRVRPLGDAEDSDQLPVQATPKRKSPRHNTATPSALGDTPPPTRSLLQTDTEQPAVDEEMTTEQPSSPAAREFEGAPSPQMVESSLFASTSSAIKSLTEKPVSFYHENAFSAVSILANKILHEFYLATTNPAYTDNSSDVIRLKDSLLITAEDFVRKLKTSDAPSGLSSSMHAPPSDPILALIEEVREVKYAQQGIVHRLNNIEGIRIPTSNPPPAPSASSSQASYARAVAGAHTPVPTTPQVQSLGSPSKATRAPSAKPKVLPETENVRIIVRCSKAPRSADSSARLPPRTIADRVNGITAKATPNALPKLVGVNWNRSNNIVLTFPSGTNAAHVVDFIKGNGIFRALEIPANTPISEDVPWSKIMVTHVPTGYGEGSGIFSDAQVTQTFINSNAWAKTLRFGQQPRWLKKPESINKSLSSVVLSFEDPTGAIIREVIRKPIFMFDTLVRVKRWEDKPILQGCSRCLGLDHNVSTCKRKTRCDRCAGDHSTVNHSIGCKACRKEKTAAGSPCPHPPKCANCRGPHCASDPSCPERAKFRKPSAPQLASLPEPSDEDMALA